MHADWLSTWQEQPEPTPRLAKARRAQYGGLNANHLVLRIEQLQNPLYYVTPGPKHAITVVVAGHLPSKPHQAIECEANQILPDGLKMFRPALQVLRYGVDIAEAALERVLLEDRRRPGGVVGGVDDLQ
jgi:hypothetical protein